jgi:hypothetical protein
MKLELTMLSKKIQARKDGYHIFSLVEFRKKDMEVNWSLLRMQ